MNCAPSSPAPPSTAKIYGKRVNLLSLENPFRKVEKEDPEKFADLVSEGAAVYIKNCQYCHGDKLDGKGPYAEGLNPTPLNFQDIGTIAQLQESYLFWRITNGWPGFAQRGSTVDFINARVAELPEAKRKSGR